MVWRSPEPSWWPIASLVSLMCTHRWTRPTQWTNVAHRVVLRKGSSRLLFFPHAPFSPFSHFHSFSFFHLSPAASASSPSLFFLLVTPFPYFIGIYLSRDVSSFYPYFFSLHSYVAAYFFALLSLIVPNAPSLSLPPSLFPSCMTLLLPFVLLRWFERFLLLNRWVFISVLRVLLEGKKKKILDCRALSIFFSFFLFLIN